MSLSPLYQYIKARTSIVPQKISPNKSTINLRILSPIMFYSLVVNNYIDFTILT